MVQRFSKVVLITTIILMVGWLISIRGFTAYRDHFGTPLGPDFLQFYTGAKLFTEGRAQALYDFQVQIETQSSILHSSQEYLHPYIYPPLLAWLLQPLAYLDYRFAFAIWSVVGIVILWRVGRYFRFGLSLGWFPVFATFSYGQNSFLSLGVIGLIGWLWIEKRSSFWSGVAAGLLLYKPQLFVGLIPIFIILKEWRVLQGMAVSGLIYLLISFYLVPEQTAEYRLFVIERIPQLVSAPGFPVTQFFDTKGFFRLLFPQIDPWVQNLLFIGVMFFFLRLFWIWLKLIPIENRALRMAGVVLLLPWTNPYFLVYDWTLLLIAYGIIKNQRSTLKLGVGGGFKMIVSMWIVALLSCIVTSAMLERCGFAIQWAPIVLAYWTYRFFTKN